MLSANWPYIVNIALFIGYFVFRKEPSVWPAPLIVWAWLPYLVHLFVHNFVDGFQNTTRNVARIYLLERHGKDFDPAKVAPIQVALVPRFMVPVTLVWFAAHIISFAALLYFQGWGTALAAEIGIICFGWVFPVNYQAHLERIAKHIDDPGKNTALQSDAVDLAGVADIVARAVKENRNPQEWWASFYQK